MLNVYRIIRVFYYLTKLIKVAQIQDANEDVKKARLLLVYAVQKTIIEGMALLGINCPEEM
jgi:arginyl-tRNA synthetase